MSHRAIATFVTLLVATVPSIHAGTDPGKHPEAPPELTALEFLVGDWDLTTSFAQPDGSRREAAARLQARYALGGFGISVEETHRYGEGVGGTFVSSVLYAVHPETRRLVGASNNTLGNRKHYEVTVEDDRLVIVQSGELFGGRQGFNRQILFNMTPNRYELRLDACQEDGEKCREGTYSYVAVRRATPTSEPTERQ